MVVAGTQLALLAGLCHTGTLVPSPREAPARSRPVRVGVAWGATGQEESRETRGWRRPSERAGTSILAEADDLHFGVRAMGLPFCL